MTKLPALQSPFTGIAFTKQSAMLTLLFGVVLAQALGVIYIKQTKRTLHAKLQNLYTQRDKLQVEWSQLLLEEGTWQTNARVERVARQKLGMVIPDKVNVILP